METEILIIAEHDGSDFDSVTFDLISWASKVAITQNWKIGVIVLGSNLNLLLEKARSLPVDTLFTLDSPALQSHNPEVFARTITDALATIKPRLILLGHTYIGIELSSKLAAALEATQWNNCRSIAASSDGFEITRPMSGGVFVSTLQVDYDTCNIMTLQRGSAPQSDLRTSKSAEVITLPAIADSSNTKIKVLGETKPDFAEDISKADLLVAIGRGIGQQSHLPAFFDLAKALGGTLAASRPLIDLGWLPFDHQVGLSGRTVRPKVYVACGISGSAQHMTGMRDSRLIIAINEDPNAPIFQLAHYGVVCDIHAILPALTRQAQQKGDSVAK